MAIIKYGVVICSRCDSRRIPNKPFYKFKKPLLNLLLPKVAYNFHTFLAVPYTQAMQYYDFFQENHVNAPFEMFYGSPTNPLKRMKDCVEVSGLEYVIRISHDKIYVDHKIIKEACHFIDNNPDVHYLYSSHLMDGSGFEIIHKDILNYASKNYGEVEHISYAARAACAALDKKTYDFGSNENELPEYAKRRPWQDYRLLIDFDKDINLIDKIVSYCGIGGQLKDAVSYLNGPGSIYSKINELPILTIYTCTYNAAKYLNDCIDSVMGLTDFNRIQYIIIDDGSTDETKSLINDLPKYYDNIKVISNSRNLGLSSSCNIALDNAKSKHIMRLDADDYLTTSTISDYVADLSSSSFDYLTPSILQGDKVIEPKENTHLGGTIFKTSALNHIRFTEGLRGYDNLDFFKRSKDILHGAHSFRQPLFFYRQREDSLSNTNLEEREKIKESIISV